MVTQRDDIKITISENYVIASQGFKQEAEGSVGGILFTHLKKNSEKIVQIDAKTGQEDTCGELLQRSIRTALHLKHRNVTRNDIITLCSSNHLNAVVPLIAAQFLGIKMSGIDPSFSPKEMLWLLTQAPPKFLFVTPQSVPIIEKLREDNCLNFEIAVFGSTSQHTKFSDFLEPHTDEDRFEPVQIENLKETAGIYFSSGTTGLPKGICVNHYSFNAFINSLLEIDNPDLELIKSQEERVPVPHILLYYSTFYWSVSFCQFLYTIASGKSCRLICENFDEKEIWNLIDRYKVAKLQLFPSEVILMLANKKSDGVATSVLNINVTGSTLPKKYVPQMKKYFPEADLTPIYGLTETGAVAMFVPHNSVHRKLMAKEEKFGSVGRPCRGLSLKVVDINTGKNLGFYQQGELLVNGKSVMSGYYNLDSSDVLDEKGWLRTGDIVYYDADFCFYVSGRIKDTFKCRDWHVSPKILEDELLGHPTVSQAVVLGIPNEDDGHHPMGVVVIKEGFRVTEKEIEKFVEERVSDQHMLRAGVRFVASMPLTPTGKVQKRKLLEILSV